MKKCSEKKKVFHAEFSGFKYTSLRNRGNVMGGRGIRGMMVRVVWQGRWECWWTRGSVVVEGGWTCVVGWFGIDSRGGYVGVDVANSGVVGKGMN